MVPTGTSLERRIEDLEQRVAVLQSESAFYAELLHRFVRTDQNPHPRHRLEQIAAIHERSKAVAA